MEDQNNNTRTDETTWNNQQKQGDHTNFNEGFSNEKLPDDYDPSKVKTAENLKRETEVDQNGNATEVERARQTDHQSPSGKSVSDESADNKVIENPDLATNRDRNYDVNPNRYPESHPDNHEHRGNIDAGNS